MLAALILIETVEFVKLGTELLRIDMPRVVSSLCISKATCPKYVLMSAAKCVHSQLKCFSIFF